MLVYLDRQIKNTSIQFNLISLDIIYTIMSEKKIKEIYVNNNFPSVQKLYLLVKKSDDTINKNEVKNF